MKTEPTEALKVLIQCVFDAYDIEGEDIENIVRYDIAKDIAMKSFKEGQSSPKIKQLEWDFYGVYYSARTPIGEYAIKEDVNYYDISNNNGCILTYNGIPLGKSHLVFDNAKAAAQADFEKRVMECLGLKAQQKQALIDMMRGDEELGLYDDFDTKDDLYAAGYDGDM